MTYILIFLISLILTIFFTPYLIGYLKKLRIIDKPGPRKIHNTDIPRMGGILIYIIVLLMTISFYRYNSSHYYLLMSSLFILICGVLDDIVGIKWSIKFLLQSIAAMFLIAYFNFSKTILIIFGLHFIYPFSILIIFLFVIGVLNSINLMDGLDGLVSGYSFLAFSILTTFAYQMQDFFLLTFLAAAIGCTLGFLKFNSFPARIFLGDAGSLMIGFFLVFSIFTILTEFSELEKTDLSFAIIFLGVPIIDTLKVMTIRLLNKRNPFLPDKNHFHHVFFENSIRHKITVFIVQTYALLFAMNSLIYIKFNKLFALILFILLSLMLVFMKNILQYVQTYEKFIKKIRIHTLPDLIINFYKKYFLIITFFIVPYILLYNFYANSLFDYKQLIFVFLCNLILLIIGVLHKIKDKYYNDIYVFFNFLIFFTLRGIVKPVIHGDILKLVYLVSIVIIIIFIVLFLLARERMRKSYNGFFSGFELILLVFILSVNLVSQSFKLSYFNFFFYGMIVSFIIYFWYRIIIYLKPKLGVIFFYLSFAISLSSTLYQIIDSVVL